MNTRTYASVLADLEAICGCSFATQEAARAKYWINRRARRAYDESEYWPRFFVVGEERVVSEDGLLPDEQTGLSDIDTVLRIHATQPFRERGAYEYADFVRTSEGTIITGYQAVEASSPTQYIVTGCENPDFNGSYAPIENDDEFPTYVNTANVNYLLTASVYDAEEGIAAYRLGQFPVAYWGTPFNTEIPSTELTPDIFNGLWSPSDAETGAPNVEAETVYSAFVTYKAALPDTYGTGDGEESNIPEEWAAYIVHGAYSDFLRNDQQQEKAAMAEMEATEILMPQLEKIGRQSGGSVFTKRISHANTQWR